MNNVPKIDIPAIHPRQRARRGAAQAENANLRATLTRIQTRATVKHVIDRSWEDRALDLAEALGAIQYLAATALAGES
jgi:hypothetical protein